MPNGSSRRVEAQATSQDPFDAKGKVEQARGRVFGLSEQLALPLRDSAGFSPDFPRFIAAES
jgi:hypothetical protein